MRTIVEKQEKKIRVKPTDKNNRWSIWSLCGSCQS